eukprot:g10254.t1
MASVREQAQQEQAEYELKAEESLKSRWAVGNASEASVAEDQQNETDWRNLRWTVGNWSDAEIADHHATIQAARQNESATNEAAALAAAKAAGSRHVMNMNEAHYALREEEVNAKADVSYQEGVRTAEMTAKIGLQEEKNKTLAEAVRKQSEANIAESEVKSTTWKEKADQAKVDAELAGKAEQQTKQDVADADAQLQQAEIDSKLDSQKTQNDLNTAEQFSKQQAEGEEKRMSAETEKQLKEQEALASQKKEQALKLVEDYTKRQQEWSGKEIQAHAKQQEAAMKVAQSQAIEEDAKTILHQQQLDEQDTKNVTRKNEIEAKEKQAESDVKQQAQMDSAKAADEARNKTNAELEVKYSQAEADKNMARLR